MLAMSVSVSVQKHARLVQVLISRSGAPLSTFANTGSVRLRPVIFKSPVLPLSADHTSATGSCANCPVSRWERTARQIGTILPTVEQSRCHAAGRLSGGCCADAQLAAVATINALGAGATPARSPPPHRH